MNIDIDLSCFQPSYQLARQQFLERVSQLPNQLIQDHIAERHPLAGPDGNDLYMDIVRLGLATKPEQLLVLISGTHGIEGFTGSAIQTYSLNSLVKYLCKRSEMGVLIIHALNPWGYAWLRRYDHEGIDINRNFIDFSVPLPENPDYIFIHRQLFDNPGIDLGDVLHQLRAEQGHQQFDEVITRGQYDYPDGLFFGGQSNSWSRTILEKHADLVCLETATRIAVIDLHTGLGPFGHGELINDHLPDTAGFHWASQWYGEHARSALLGESCSTPKLGLVDYFWHPLIGNRGSYVTLEYGTYHLEQLLQISCEEQRYYNHCQASGLTRDVEHACVRELRDFFFPQDKAWQQLVLFRSWQVINMAIEGLRDNILDRSY